jgi:NADPH:quinone reductase-like Zn-dependent oxidoreductase
MKAMVIQSFGEIDELQQMEIDKPDPAPGEVQIQLAYAGVNPVDWKICNGIFRGQMPHEFPVTLGWDGAGVVSAVGKGVTNLKVGDEVFAYFRKEKIHDGTYCEYATYPAEHVVKKPKNLTLAEASVIPLSTLTAWQALFDFAHLKEGQTLLIHGGAGGVGSIAIQLARWKGAKIFTTASARNHDYVKQLGADVAIDYGTESWEERIRAEGKADVIFDCVGGSVLRSCYELVKEGGALVSIVAPPDEKRAKGLKIRSGFVFVSPNGDQLTQIASLVEQKKLVVPHLEELPLSQAREALERSKEGHVRGKIALKIGA